MLKLMLKLNHNSHSALHFRSASSVPSTSDPFLLPSAICLMCCRDFRTSSNLFSRVFRDLVVLKSS